MTPTEFMNWVLALSLAAVIVMLLALAGVLFYKVFWGGSGHE